LNDAGAGLAELAKSHGVKHYLCFRHMLESLGTKIYAAVLVHSLLFSTTKRVCQELRVIILPDFLSVCPVTGAITDKAQWQFARLFGVTQNDERGWFVNKKDPSP
jgi:hypothetical protein